MRSNKLAGNFLVIVINSLARGKTRETVKMFVTLLERHLFTLPLFPVTEGHKEPARKLPHKNRPDGAEWETRNFLSGKMGREQEPHPGGRGSQPIPRGYVL